MSRLFGREVAVTLARPVAGQFFAQQPNAIVVRDLRVQFSVEKNLSGEPNTCTVTISNLSEQTRAEVQRKPLHVRLDAGYDGQLARLFTGDLRWAQSQRSGTEWETVLELGDGERAYRHARVNRSYRAGVDGKTAIKDVAASMGLRVPENVDDVRGLLGQFSGGITLQGPSQRELERILKPKGLSASIQDGELQILSAQGVRADQAIVVSQDTGLVGQPELGAPKEPGKSPVLSLTMLLYPGLIPGGRIQVQTQAIRGLFRVERVVHTGDTHGQAWFSEVEATLL